MQEPFSPLELQLIRSSLATKPDDEIAALLERPIEQVIEVINEITEGKAGERSLDVTRYLQELQTAKEKKKGRPVSVLKKAKDKEREELRSIKNQKRHEAERKWEIQRENTRKRERKYPTRKLDLENCISVKLDDKTYALVEKQKTEEATKALIEMTKFNFNLMKRKRLHFKDDES